MQKTSAANYVQAYQKLIIEARRNTKAKKLYTEAYFINAFLKGLKPDVGVHLTEMTFATLEAAYEAAERKDVKVHQARTANAVPPGPRKNGSNPWTSRAPPAPPGPPPLHHLSALLAQLGYKLDDAAIGSSNLAAIGKDHSVSPDQPIPKMTPDIKAWCLKNNACFRCRLTPEQQDKLLNGRHQSGACPRFAGRPDHALGAVADEEDASSGNDE